MKNFVKFLLLLFVLVSCSKENDINVIYSGKTKKVTIKNVGYKFNEKKLSKSGDDNNVIARSIIDIDDQYALSCKLVEVNNTSTKLDLEYNQRYVDCIHAVTFYRSPKDKTQEYRIQRVECDENHNFEIELPIEGQCDVLFIGQVLNEHGDTQAVPLDIKYENGITSIESVPSGVNLCYCSMSFDTFPLAIEGMTMTPMFAQIATIYNSGESITNPDGYMQPQNYVSWKIQSISNLTISNGVQQESGIIKFNKYQYDSYENVGAGAVPIDNNIYFDNGVISIEEPRINIIPNDDSYIAIDADVVLDTYENDGPKRVKFKTEQYIHCGYYYIFYLEIIKKGYKIKFYINTNQNGNYSQEFDYSMNELVYKEHYTSGNDEITGAPLIFYDYNTTLYLPDLNLQGDAVNYHLPQELSNFLECWGWSFENFLYMPSHDETYNSDISKFSDFGCESDVNIYAIWKPKKEEYGVSSSEMPTIRDFRKYLYDIHSIYYQQPSDVDDEKLCGYWIKKWEYGPKDVTGVIDGIDNISTEEYTEIKVQLQQGEEPLNKNEYFFIPVMFSESSIFWASDAPVDYETLFQVVEFGLDGVIKIYNRTSNGIQGLYHYGEQFYSYWPDETYLQ